MIKIIKSQSSVNFVELLANFVIPGVSKEWVYNKVTGEFWNEHFTNFKYFKLRGCQIKR